MILRVRCCRYLHARSPSDLGSPKSRADLSPFTHTLKSNDLAIHYRAVTCRDVAFKVFIFGL